MLFYNLLRILLVFLVIVLIIIIILEMWLITYKSTSIKYILTNKRSIYYPGEDKYSSEYWYSKTIYNRLYILVPVYNSDIDILEKRLDKLIEYGRESIIIVYGYDSTLESTIEGLNRWKERKSNKEHYYFPDALANITNLDRTVKLGKIRNYLLQLAIEHQQLHGYTDTSRDFVLVYDGDHKGCLSKIGLLDSIYNIYNNTYDVAASYGTADFLALDFPYDSYALRLQNTEWDRVASYSDLLSIKLGYVYQVNSAFSGAAVYRYNDIVQCKYSEKKDFCEHVGLHKQLHNMNKKIVINKKMHIYVGHQ